MSHYIDASVLVAYYHPEKFTNVAQEKLIKLTQPIISNHTEVEFYSALAKKVRMTEIDFTLLDAKKIIDKYTLHLRKRHIVKKCILNKHFNQAKLWLRDFSTALRSGDALHLAFAFQNDFTLMNSDNVLAKSAETIGAKVDFIPLDITAHDH